MQDNTKIYKRIIGFTVGIWLISLLVFFLYCVQAPRINKIYVMLYGVWNLILFLTSYTLICRKANKAMAKVNDCIQNMIDGHPIEHFSQQEESLLGKFQMQLMKLYQILDGARQQEETMRQELSALVADLVHQVNTPLTNIQMYSGFLMQDELEKEEKEHICQVIDSQVEKLGWFAQGFTKTARLEDNMRSMDPKKQPILPMVLSAIDEVSLKAMNHGNEICLEGEQNICAVYDRRWTEEAIFNLLDNAVKYGRESTPILVRMTKYQLFVRIDVASCAEPIPREEYPRLFERFYRGKNAALIKDGVGLGLYLTRRILAEQGGFVKVEADGKKGNVFSVFLPAAFQEKERQKIN